AHAEAVAVALRAGPDGREVAARAGLAEELAPHLVAGEDRREKARLLLRAAVGDERRPGVVDADPVQELRRAGASELFVQDGLMDGRGGVAAVLARPEEADVARVVER